MLCPNVGVGQYGAVDALTDQDWDWVLSVNVLGVIQTVRTFLPLLRAGEGGGLGQITLGENDVADLGALKTELQAIVNDPSLPFDQALIKVDPDLKYAELMKVINVFNSLEPKPLTKISFAELGAADGAGGSP